MKPLAISLAQFADLMSVSKSHAHRLVKSGAVPSLNLGGLRVIPLRWVEEAVARVAAGEGEP